MLNGIAAFLHDKRRLIDRLALAADETEPTLARAALLARQLASSSLSEQRSTLAELVKRIHLTQARIRVDLQAVVLQGKLDAENDGRTAERAETDAVALEIPVAFKRRGVETKIVIEGEANTGSTPDRALIKSVTSAHRWFADLKTGEVRSIKALAERHGVDKGDVSRILPLAFLAPDIVEAILDGRHPVDLTAYRLKRIHTLPFDWQEQRTLLGFS